MGDHLECILFTRAQVVSHPTRCLGQCLGLTWSNGLRTLCTCSEVGRGVSASARDLTKLALRRRKWYIMENQGDARGAPWCEGGGEPRMQRVSCKPLQKRPFCMILGTQQAPLPPGRDAQPVFPHTPHDAPQHTLASGSGSPLRHWPSISRSVRGATSGACSSADVLPSCGIPTRNTLSHHDGRVDWSILPSVPTARVTRRAQRCWMSDQL